MKNRMNTIEVHQGARRTYEFPIEGSRGGWRTEHVKMKGMNDEGARKSQHSDDNSPQMTCFLGGGATPPACGILVPWPESKPVPPHWEQAVLTTEPPGKSQ